MGSQGWLSKSREPGLLSEMVPGLSGPLRVKVGKRQRQEMPGSFLCPFVYPSTRAPTHASIHPRIHAPTHASTHPCIHPPMHPPMHPCTRASTYPSMHASIFLSSFIKACLVLSIGLRAEDTDTNFKAYYPLRQISSSLDLDYNGDQRDGVCITLKSTGTIMLCSKHPQESSHTATTFTERAVCGAVLTMRPDPAPVAGLG